MGFLAACFLGHGSSIASATCVTWPYRVGCRIFGKFAGPTTTGDIATRFRDYQRLMNHWRTVLPVRLWKSTTRKRWPIWKAWHESWWIGAVWRGSQRAWSFTRETAGQNGECSPGATTGLRDIGGKVEALRTGPGFAVRPAGRGGSSQPRGSVAPGVAAGNLCRHNGSSGFRCEVVDPERSEGSPLPVKSARFFAPLRMTDSPGGRIATFCT